MRARKVRGEGAGLEAAVVNSGKDGHDLVAGLPAVGIAVRDPSKDRRRIRARSGGLFCERAEFAGAATATVMGRLVRLPRELPCAPRYSRGGDRACGHQPGVGQ